MSKHPSLPTPPGSPSSSSSSPSFSKPQETSDPIARLDALLEIYLDRLDTYQRLREELSKNFSAGFLSLAHANRTTNLGSGRRYGEEGYDERMKAGRRVKLGAKGKEDLVAVGACWEAGDDQPLPAPAQETIFYKVERFNSSGDASDDTSKQSPLPKETTAQASASPSPDPRDPNTSSMKTPTTLPASSPSPTQPPIQTPNLHPHPHSNSNSNTKSKQKIPPNPLHWYGVLVPPSLRAAQTSFTRALEEQIPQLLNIQTEMADLESQIRQSRTEAGVSHVTSRDGDGE